MRGRQAANDEPNHGYMRLTVARTLSGTPPSEREVILDVGPEEFASILRDSEKVAIFEWGRYKPEGGWAYGSEEHRRIAVLLTVHSDKIVEREALEITKRRGLRSSRSAGLKSAASPMGREKAEA